MTRLDKAAQSLGYADWEELKVKPHPDVERAQALAALTRAEQCLAEVYETIGMASAAEHIRKGLQQIPTGQAALAVIDRYLAQRDDDGWIEWGGGNEPPVEGPVRTRHRNGYEQDTNAENLWWEHHGIGGDIIAYKVD